MNIEFGDKTSLGSGYLQSIYDNDEPIFIYEQDKYYRCEIETNQYNKRFIMIKSRYVNNKIKEIIKSIDMDVVNPISSEGYIKIAIIKSNKLLLPKTEEIFNGCINIEIPSIFIGQNKKVYIQVHCKEIKVLNIRKSDINIDLSKLTISK